jgi:hypothetical protein
MSPILHSPRSAAANASRRGLGALPASHGAVGRIGNLFSRGLVPSESDGAFRAHGLALHTSDKGHFHIYDKTAKTRSTLALGGPEQYRLRPGATGCASMVRDPKCGGRIRRMKPSVHTKLPSVVPTGMEPSASADISLIVRLKDKRCAHLKGLGGREFA